MNYQVSEFEQQHINKIKEELEKYPNITAMEKAYYIYYRMCQFYIRNYDYYYGHGKEFVKAQYYKQTEKDRKSTCYQENASISEAMRQIGIYAGYIQSDKYHHVDGYFMLDTKAVYFFNAYVDLTRAKTGKILRGFGLDFETIKITRTRDYREFILNYFNKNGINLDSASTNEITEEKIREMNQKLGINYYAVPTNDFISKLEEVMENEEYLERKFGTKDKGKQIEGIIDILNIHKVPNDTEFEIDYSTGSEYYSRIFEMFPAKYVEIFDGKQIGEQADSERKIFFVKEEGNLVAYEFDEETKKLKKQNVNELAKQNIDYLYNYRGYEKLEGNKRKIGYAINKMQKECEVPEH